MTINTTCLAATPTISFLLVDHPAELAVATLGLAGVNLEAHVLSTWEATIASNPGARRAQALRVRDRMEVDAHERLCDARVEHFSGHVWLPVLRLRHSSFLNHVPALARLHVRIGFRGVHNEVEEAVPPFLALSLAAECSSVVVECVSARHSWIVVQSLLWRNDFSLVVPPLDASLDHYNFRDMVV